MPAAYAERADSSGSSRDGRLDSPRRETPARFSGLSGDSPGNGVCVVPDQRIFETKCMSRVKIRWSLGANSVQ